MCPIWRVKSSNSLPVSTDQVLDFAAVPFQLWGMWGRGQWVGVEQPGGFGRDVSVVGGKGGGHVAAVVSRDHVVRQQMVVGVEGTQGVEGVQASVERVVERVEVVLMDVMVASAGLFVCTFCGPPIHCSASVSYRKETRHYLSQMKMSQTK